MSAADQRPPSVTTSDGTTSCGPCPIQVKVAVVGDPVGKTSVLTQLRKITSNKVNGSGTPATIELDSLEDLPSVLEPFSRQVPIENHIVEVSLYDTPSSEDQELYRKQTMYLDCHVFVVMFALDDVSTFDRVSDYWRKEIKDTCVSPCIILVGNRLDVSSDKRHVSLLDGLEMQVRLLYFRSHVFRHRIELVPNCTLRFQQSRAKIW